MCASPRASRSRTESAVTSVPAMRISPLVRSAKADDRLDERALAIPFHAGDPEDLARLHREGHVVHRARAPLARDDEIAHLEHGC